MRSLRIKNYLTATILIFIACLTPIAAHAASSLPGTREISEFRMLTERERASLEATVEAATVVVIVQVDLGEYHQPRYLRSAQVGSLVTVPTPAPEGDSATTVTQEADPPQSSVAALILPLSAVYGADRIEWHDGQRWVELKISHQADDLDLACLEPSDPSQRWDDSRGLKLGEELPANQAWWTRAPVSVPEEHVDSGEPRIIWQPSRRQRSWFERQADEPQLIAQLHNPRSHRRFSYFLRSPFPMLDRGYPLVDSDGSLVGITARTPSDGQSASAVISYEHIATFFQRIATQDGDAQWRPTIREEQVEVRTGREALGTRRR